MEQQIAFLMAIDALKGVMRRSYLVSLGRNENTAEHSWHVAMAAMMLAEQGREMMLVTERAVFRLEPDGLVLTEIAPGIDLERDVLARMGFRPRLAPVIATMDAACFTDAPLGLRERIEARRVPHRSARVQAWREARQRA